jgi:hypothetical protein
MLIASFRRKVILFLLLAIVALPWASAAGPLPEGVRPAKAAAPALDLLSRFWSFLTSVWSDTGCMIDPSGGCAPQPQEAPDTGCHIDPSGGCSS